MSRGQTYTAGTSAYDLDRWGALPEIEIPEGPRPRERERTHVVAPPSEQTRERVNTRTKAREAKRQSVSKFAVLGGMVVGVLLLMIVLSHMQLAMISHEMVELERQMGDLREETVHLRIAHENAFGRVEVERFARDELGMVEAARGQMVFIGSSLAGDVAEIIRVEEVAIESRSFLDHAAGLFTYLRAALEAYLPFL